MTHLDQIIARGDVVDFRDTIKRLSAGELTVLLGKVAKQKALSDALWAEIRSRKK